MVEIVLSRNQSLYAQAQINGDTEKLEHDDDGLVI
jgi:hypothetical protein